MTTNHEDFYSELDRRKYRPSFSCASLILFLLMILLSLSFIVYWGIAQIKAKISSQKVTVSGVALEQAETKLQDFLKGGRPSGEVVTITLTDQELTSLLVKNETLSENKSFGLKDPSAVITPNGVELSAQLIKPLNSRITALGRPVIVGGQVEFNLINLQAGKLSVPTFLHKGIDDLLNRLVTSRLNTNTIVYETVTLGDHLLTLTGREK